MSNTTPTNSKSFLEAADAFCEAGERFVANLQIEPAQRALREFADDAISTVRVLASSALRFGTDNDKLIVRYATKYALANEARKDAARCRSFLKFIDQASEVLGYSAVGTQKDAIHTAGAWLNHEDPYEFASHLLDYRREQMDLGDLHDTEDDE